MNQYQIFHLHDSQKILNPKLFHVKFEIVLNNNNLES